MANIAEYWLPFRYWNRVGIFLVLALLPLAGLSVLLGQVLGISGAIVLVPFAAWVVAFGYVVHRIRTFPCPRCGDFYTTTSWMSPNTLGRKCIHCGLRLYAQI
jgi:hypothetical protein